jgi:putative flippase GtrA
MVSHPMTSPQRLLISDSGLFGQGVRFALVGGLAAVIYLLSTTVLALLLGLPFEVALPIGFCLGMGVHFTLQRVFVWGHGARFALRLHQQAGRYLLVAGAQYGVTAASTATLPRALGLPTEIVYLATVVLLTGCNFVVFRNGVFHAEA